MFLCPLYLCTLSKPTNNSMHLQLYCLLNISRCSAAPSVLASNPYQWRPSVQYSTSACSLQCSLVISLFKCKWDLWWFVMDCEVQSLAHLLRVRVCLQGFFCVCACFSAAGLKQSGCSNRRHNYWMISSFFGSQKYLLIVCVSSLRLSCGGLSRGV